MPVQKWASAICFDQSFVPNPAPTFFTVGVPTSYAQTLRVGTNGRLSRVALLLSRFPFANGINASADGSTLYVASTLGRDLRVYARDPEAGALELRETIPLGTGPDNIEVDEQGTLWVGAHPKLLQLSRYLAGREPYAPAQVLRLTEAGDAWQVEEIYLDTGAALSAASVAAHHDGRLLIGAVRGDRFLDCQVF